MEALITVSYGDDELDIDRIRDLALFAMGELGVPENTEVSITFVSDAEIADLNESYRQKQGPTDVLSFECDNIEDSFPTGDGTYELGDVIIAPAVARRQSVEYGNGFMQETSMLLVHGILHLCGYDHVDNDEAVIMESRQGEILGEWYARMEQSNE